MFVHRVVSACLLITIGQQSPKAETGQKLCETDRRLCFTGLCPIDECIECGQTATCTTSNPKEVVPRKLLATMKYLYLTYNGPPISLTAATFDHLEHLKEIQISGNVESIAPDTFVKQWNLKWLTITGSKLNSLPNQVFNNDSRLEHLNLPHNRFTEIPINIFTNIKNIQRLDFSYNPINSCKGRNDTIAPEFETLQYLYEIRLSGYGSSIDLCKHISRDYLQPIRRIRVLDLSESLLFYGDQQLLSPLLNLQHLAIDNVPPYTKCPASAKRLFLQMPDQLNNLTMRNWASMDYVNKSCILDEDALIGLKKLKKLSLLDVRYGDRLFGNTLAPSIFDGFNRIRVVYIDWCGISSIETGAFSAVPYLVNLGLSGNMLGPRELQLYINDQPSKLKTLNLNAVGINIRTYHMAKLLLSFPLLKLLYLDDNLLQNIPDFGYSNNVSSLITTLTLNNNKIQSLSHLAGDRLCKVMTLLSVFKAEKNKIIDISGIAFCFSITQVYLANNLVGKNMYANFKALGKLHKLSHLDLSHNKIQYLTYDLFSNLTKLRTLNVADNEITSLPIDVFSKTPHLSSLDFSSNLLTAFNTDILSDGLTQMVNLYLQANQIKSLSAELLTIISTRLTKLKRLGLVGNPLTCSCDNYLTDWVRNSSVIMQVKNLTCTPPDKRATTVRVIYYQPNYFQCKVKHKLIISAEVLAAAIVGILLALPCYKYRWYIRHPLVVLRAIGEKLREVQFHQKCEYDAFISYDTMSDSDTRWVQAKLIPAIENVAGREESMESEIKLYVVDRDSPIGSPQYTQRCKAIESSRKIIIILSNSYLDEPTCLSEADLVAGYQLVDGQHCYQPNRILVLILEDLNEETIKAPVTSLLTRNVIHIVDNETKMKRIWKQVRQFLSKPQYIYRKKNKISANQQMPADDDVEMIEMESLSVPLVTGQH